MPDPNDRPDGPDRSSSAPASSWPMTAPIDPYTVEFSQPAAPDPGLTAGAGLGASAGAGAQHAVPARSAQGRSQPWTESTGRRLDVIARIACLSAGCALVIAAIVGLFVDVDAGALIAVLAAGVVLVLLPSVVDRLRSFKAGQFEIQLMAQIAGTARKSAETLRHLGMERELNAYAAIYTELRGSEMNDVRAQLLDRIVQRVSNASAVEKFDKAEVKDLFLEGSPIVRVLALGLMEGDLSLIDSAVLLDAVDKSLTGNEQFHALVVILYGWGRLSPDERTMLTAAIDASPQIKPGTNRGALAQQIRELAGSSRIR